VHIDRRRGFLWQQATGLPDAACAGPDVQMKSGPDAYGVERSSTPRALSGLRWCVASLRETWGNEALATALLNMLPGCRSRRRRTQASCTAAIASVTSHMPSFVPRLQTAAFRHFAVSRG
jgi:hypothetical protein